MVDHARSTDINRLMDQKQWGTDDFQQALKTHTEQVCALSGYRPGRLR